MKFETLKKDNKKKIAIGIIAVISITLVGVFASSFAKYQLTQSIPLANGTINYKAYDFKIMAMYQQKEGSTCTEENCYNEISIMPESGYVINETKSYCTIDNKNKDTKAKLYTNENEEHVIAKLSKSDKCYLYFDKQTAKKVKTILGILTVNAEEPSFADIAITDEGVFVGSDNDGTSYYYRGAVTNNYLRFANKWWRIIRINGDRTIRIIYDGTEYHANGTSTADGIALTSIKFNTSYNHNAYVGFMYGATSGIDYAATHANTTKSNIMKELETWYTSNLATYTSKIDTNAGFCGDRIRSTSTSSINNTGGVGTATTYYGAYIRLLNSTKTPNLECPNTNDLYTVNEATRGNKALDKPIGLITADEVAMAGGAYNAENSKYYLYNNQYFWTMSPSSFGGSNALVFRVDSSGNLALGSNMFNSTGVRPVINLRADVSITGSGTQNDPYVVS